MTDPIRTAIALLYAEADTPHPTIERCITPLAKLIPGSPGNLVSVELERLTRRSASSFLLGRGARLEALPGADEERLAGFLYADPGVGCLFVERNDRLTRRRFSVGHELGHFMLHFRPLLTGACAEELTLTGLTDALVLPADEGDAGEVSQGSLGVPEAARLPDPEQMEREADLFAAELLMPEEVVRALADRYGRDFRGEDLVCRLSTEMLVSRMAMRWRLRSLNLLLPVEYQLN